MLSLVVEDARLGGGGEGIVAVVVVGVVDLGSGERRFSDRGWVGGRGRRWRR